MKIKNLLQKSELDGLLLQMDGLTNGKQLTQ